ncbi:extended synaptotagmin-2-like isoform X2 [Antedon mediterranea]|uniref:extended synaptotagmin-2-like isoform X2 n=1 Tax=Antedon mediterranea TaxID=105859 RepID=UPI003AF669C5
MEASTSSGAADSDDLNSNLDDETTPDIKETTSHAVDDLLPILKKYVGVFFMLFSIWFMGYCGFSSSWVFMIVIVLLLREKATKRKEVKLLVARQAVTSERQVIEAAVQELPSWVYFPDTERAEWLNKIVKQLWPFIEGYVTDLLKETVEPSVQEALPSYLKSFRFEKIKLGRYPPRIGGVKVYTDKVARDEIVMDLELFYAGDCDIEISFKTLKRIKAGIQDIQLHGTLRVEIKPLVNIMPLIGGMSFFFLNKPATDFNLTNLADVLDIPGISGILRNIIEDQIAHFLVLPNRIPVSLMEDVDLTSLKYPMPEGVLRINIVEARNLMKMDIGFLKKGKSDPYVVVEVGAHKFKTKVINNTCDPSWNKYFEVVVFEKLGQTVEIDLFDKDADKDDPMGNLSLDIDHISQAGSLDSWLPLEDATNGELHINLTWLSLSHTMNDLNVQLAQCRHIESTMGELVSSAILIVRLDSAKDLPTSKKSSSLPSPYCLLSLGHVEHKSRIIVDNSSPVWEQVFHFLVQDPNVQSLDVTIKDSKKDKSVGVLNIPLRRVLSQPDFVLEQPFNVDHSGPQSRLFIRLCVRALEAAPKKSKMSVSDPKAFMVVRKSESVSSVNVDEDDDEDDNDNTLETDADEHVFNGNHNGIEDLMMNDDNANTELRKRHLDSTKSLQALYPYGRLQLSLSYSKARSKLTVLVQKATQIIGVNSDRTSNAYVRIYLMPDKSSRHKTKVIKKTRNPIFNERFEFHCSESNLSDAYLDVCIKNSAFLSVSTTCLGKVEIPLNSMDLSTGNSDWYVLQKDEEDDSISRISAS